MSIINLDLSKGSIVINNTNYTYYNTAGQQTGNHLISNSYIITTSGATSNSITLSGANLKCDLTLTNVNTTGIISASQLTGDGKEIVLRLSGTNSVGRIHYTGKSKFYITSAAGDGSLDGSLTVASTDWNAAIGATNEDKHTYGLVIAGGTITATATSAAAIGGGGNGNAEILITGGYISAKNSGNSATIGGGGSGSSVAGDGQVRITGGTVIVTKESGSVGNGAGIGGGGVNAGIAGKGFVRIEGGTVSSSTYGTGASIGGGGSALTGTAAEGEIIITGGIVYTEGLYVSEIGSRGSAIGGGSCSGSGAGGKGIVTILGGAVIAKSRGYGATIGSGGSVTGETKESIIAISGDTAQVTVTNSGNGVAIGTGCTTGTGITPGSAHIYITHSANVNATIILQGSNPSSALGNKYIISAGSNPAPANSVALTQNAVYGQTYYQADNNANVVVGYRTNFDVEPVLLSDAYIHYDSTKIPTLTPVIIDLAKGHVIFKADKNIAQYKATEDASSVKWQYTVDREYIIVQNNVVNVVPYRIAFLGNTVEYAITLHSINSGYEASIKIPADIGNQKNVTIRLSGKNYINDLLYYTNTEENSTLTLTTAFGTEGELIVRPSGGGGSNTHHGAAIGGRNAPSEQKSARGLIIAGGKIDVLTTEENNCIAIGGGGNGYANIQITGGTVIAESSSSGATIGGGLAFTGEGSYADIKISGGIITAINHGTTNSPAILEGRLYGTAIGGGSSYESSAASGHESVIEITGGKIYVEVPDGYTAIGGGNSYMSNAGNGQVVISDGEVVCVGNIGGGSTVKGNGGNATVIINNGNLSSSTIGGGGSTEGQLGAAYVILNDGFVQSQILMQGSGSTFEMNGGVIDNSNKNRNMQSDGGAVYIEEGSAVLNNGTIQNCNAVHGGAICIYGGDFTMNGGEIFMTGAQNGGAICVEGGNVTINSGSITNCSAISKGGAIYLHNGIVTIGRKGCSGTESGYHNLVDYANEHCPIIMDNTAEVGKDIYTTNKGVLYINCGTLGPIYRENSTVSSKRRIMLLNVLHQ